MVQDTGNLLGIMSVSSFDLILLLQLCQETGRFLLESNPHCHIVFTVALVRVSGRPIETSHKLVCAMAHDEVCCLKNKI